MTPPFAFPVTLQKGSRRCFAATLRGSCSCLALSPLAAAAAPRFLRPRLVASFRSSSAATCLPLVSGCRGLLARCSRPRGPGTPAAMAPAAFRSYLAAASAVARVPWRVAVPRVVCGLLSVAAPCSDSARSPIAGCDQRYGLSLGCVGGGGRAVGFSDVFFGRPRRRNLVGLRSFSPARGTAKLARAWLPFVTAANRRPTSAGPLDRPRLSPVPLPCT